MGQPTSGTRQSRKVFEAAYGKVVPGGRSQKQAHQEHGRQPNQGKYDESLRSSGLGSFSRVIFDWDCRFDFHEVTDHCLTRARRFAAPRAPEIKSSTSLTNCRRYSSIGKNPQSRIVASFPALASENSRRASTAPFLSFSPHTNNIGEMVRPITSSRNEIASPDDAD